MAFNSYQASLGATDTTVMVAASSSIIIEVRITNTYGATIPVDVKLQRAGTTTYLVRQGRVLPSEAYVLQGSKIVLQSGDQIIASSVVDNAADILVSALTGLS